MPWLVELPVQVFWSAVICGIVIAAACTERSSPSTSPNQGWETTWQSCHATESEAATSRQLHKETNEGRNWYLNGTARLFKVMTHIGREGTIWALLPVAKHLRSRFGLISTGTLSFHHLQRSITTYKKNNIRQVAREMRFRECLETSYPCSQSLLLGHGNCPLDQKEEEAYIPQDVLAMFFSKRIIVIVAAHKQKVIWKRDLCCESVQIWAA